jgi:hypothetical protein
MLQGWPIGSYLGSAGLLPVLAHCMRAATPSCATRCCSFPALHNHLQTTAAVDAGCVMLLFILPQAAGAGVSFDEGAVVLPGQQNIGESLAWPYTSAPRHTDRSQHLPEKSLALRLRPAGRSAPLISVLATTSGYLASLGSL